MAPPSKLAWSTVLQRRNRQAVPGAMHSGLHRDAHRIIGPRARVADPHLHYHMCCPESCHGEAMSWHGFARALRTRQYGPYEDRFMPEGGGSNLKRLTVALLVRLSVHRRARLDWIRYLRVNRGHLRCEGFLAGTACCSLLLSASAFIPGLTIFAGRNPASWPNRRVQCRKPPHAPS